MSDKLQSSLFLEPKEWLESNEDEIDGAICQGDTVVDKNGMNWMVLRRKRKDGLVWDYILESECDSTRRKMWGKWITTRFLYGIEITDQKSIETYKTWYLIKFGKELDV